MTWHMLKTRAGTEVHTRCGDLLKLRTGQALPDINVTGIEHRVTCPECILPRKE